MGLLGNNKRTTNNIGDISEAAIIARFLQLGYVVLTVYGGNQRYDLVIMPKGNSGACNVKRLGYRTMEQWLHLTRRITITP